MDMEIYMWIYIYIMYILMYIYSYTCAYKFVNMYTYIYMNIYIYMYKFICIYIYIYVHTYVCLWTFICISADAFRIKIHTDTYPDTFSLPMHQQGEGVRSEIERVHIGEEGGRKESDSETDDRERQREKWFLNDIGIMCTAVQVWQKCHGPLNIDSVCNRQKCQYWQLFVVYRNWPTSQ